MSVASEKAAMPLAFSPGGPAGGTAGRGGMNGWQEQVGPEQGRGFLE